MIILLFILLLLLIYIKSQEKFAATSPGTVIQLVAKGTQDVYLTGY